MDTSAYHDYLKALAACDVLVLPYDPHAYAYRTSGVISEALACGCAAVVPNVPGLREQITVPDAVGICYEGTADIPRAVVAATQLSRTPHFRESLAAHKAHRGVEGLANALRSILNAEA
jgi:glycosyltransferase involved in cell wall biosynthesis